MSDGLLSCCIGSPAGIRRFLPKIQNPVSTTT